MLAIKNGRTVCEKGISNQNVYIQNGKIFAVTDEFLECEEVIDAGQCYVAPGFIDIHVHGAGGSDFLDGTAEDYLIAAQTHAKHGTTALLPTLTSVDAKGIRVAATAFAKARTKNEQGAELLGLHLEGPYLAQSQSGAQEPRFIRNYDPEEYESILEDYGDLILRWTAAPELPGADAFARALAMQGIVPSIGHSDADFDCAAKAFSNGFSLITHLYSCMSTVHRKNAYRYAGIIEYAYYNDDMNVEIIADGSHLPPSLLKLIYKLKGAEHIALVTDSMRGAGMPEGKSILGRRTNGLEVIIEDGVAKLPDRSAFAGSVATFDRLVRNMVTLADVPLCDALKMASETPAKIMRLKNKGKIKPNYDADIVIFDDNIDIKKTIVGGKVVLF